MDVVRVDVIQGVLLQVRVMSNDRKQSVRLHAFFQNALRENRVSVLMDYSASEAELLNYLPEFACCTDSEYAALLLFAVHIGGAALHSMGMGYYVAGNPDEDRNRIYINLLAPMDAASKNAADFCAKYLQRVARVFGYKVTPVVSVGYGTYHIYFDFVDWSKVDWAVMANNQRNRS